MAEIETPPGEEMPDDLAAEAAVLQATAEQMASADQLKIDAAASKQAAAADEQQANAAAEYSLLITGALTPAFMVLAPNWAVEGAEIEALAGAYGALLAKYYPEPTQMGAEVAAVAVTLAVFAPRLKVPRKVLKRPPSENQPDMGPDDDH